MICRRCLELWVSLRRTCKLIGNVSGIRRTCILIASVEDGVGRSFMVIRRLFQRAPLVLWKSKSKWMRRRVRLWRRSHGRSDVTLRLTPVRLLWNWYLFRIIDQWPSPISWTPFARFETSCVVHFKRLPDSCFFFSFSGGGCEATTESLDNVSVRSTSVWRGRLRRHVR